MRLRTESSIEEHATGYYHVSFNDGGFFRRDSKRYPKQKRVGSVILRESSSEIAFAQSDEVDAKLVPALADPSLGYYPPPRPLDEFSYQAELADKPRLQKLRERLSLIALPLVGVGAAEMGSSGHWHDTLGLGAGLVAVGAHRFVESQRRLANMDQRLDNVDYQFSTAEEYVTLPQRSKMIYIPQNGAFLDESVVVTAEGVETTTSRREVLQQMARLHLYGSDTFITFNTQLEDICRYGVILEDEIDTRNRTSLTYEGVKSPGRRVVKLSTTPFTVEVAWSKHQERADDTYFSAVHIPPASLVTTLLQHSRNPDRLWAHIEPKLVEFASEIEQGNFHAKELTRLQELREHTGSDDEKLHQQIEASEQGSLRSQRAQLKQCIEIAAIGLRINEIEDYTLMREKLINALEMTDNAEAQGEAIKLIDTAFAAFMRNMPVDSNESTQLGERLMQYLEGSMQFLTLNEGNGTHVYAGLCKKFPELGLSAELG